jgi:NTP pyrophosphatase (non-canonical NTP hydrolase)
MDISEIPKRVEELESTRGFSHENVPDKVKCFKEESEEFLEAINGNGDIADEGADVIYTVVMIFKREGIDLKTALLNKYKKDKMRV